MEELWYNNRTAILQLAKFLKGSKIFINEAFMDVLRKKRKEYMVDLKAASVSMII